MYPQQSYPNYPNSTPSYPNYGSPAYGPGYNTPSYSGSAVPPAVPSAVPPAVPSALPPATPTPGYNSYATPSYNGPEYSTAYTPSTSSVPNYSIPTTYSSTPAPAVAPVAAPVQQAPAQKALPKTPDELISQVKSEAFDQYKVKLVKESFQQNSTLYSGAWICAKAKELILCFKYSQDQKDIMHLVYPYVTDKIHFYTVVDCLKYSSEKESVMKSLGVAPPPAYNPNPVTPAGPGQAPGTAPAPAPDFQLQAQLSAAHLKIKQLEEELKYTKSQVENLQKKITLFEGDQDFLKQLDEENAIQGEEIKAQEKIIAQKTALLLEKDLIIEELQQKLEDLLNPQQHMISSALRDKEKPKGNNFSEDNLAALLSKMGDLDDI